MSKKAKGSTNKGSTKKKIKAQSDPVASKVAAQYETLPYPERDPNDETARLIAGSPSDLWELNHYIFGGVRDWNRPFRALIAGGGTGDATIMLAQQLSESGIDATLVHLDVSQAAQDVARARADRRGLKNIEFQSGSLLDLGKSDGKFDYIDCCGVLHHLADPAAGLAALVGVLEDDGGLGLMVYGALGRTGVYHAQDTLRLLAPQDLPADERLDRAKRLLRDLPPTNWLARNPFVTDHLEGGDAGLYDLLLHDRDRAFQVQEIATLIDDAGLQVATFIEPARYDPASYLKDPRLLRQAAELSQMDQARLAEQLAGNFARHILYATKKSNPVTTPDPNNRQAIPVLRDVTPQAVAGAITAGGQFTARQSGFEMAFKLPSLAKPILERCDGSATLDDIYAAIVELRSDLDWDVFIRQFGEIYKVFNGINRLHLKLA